MQDWEIRRLNLFRAEILKMFLAYNKTIQKQTVDSKSELTADTLSSLRTEKIKAFFQYVRENCDTLPSDGLLKKLLRAKADEFTVKKDFKQLPQHDVRDLPDDEWMANYHAGMKMIFMGKISPKEVKQSLGLI